MQPPGTTVRARSGGVGRGASTGHREEPSRDGFTLPISAVSISECEHLVLKVVTLKFSACWPLTLKKDSLCCARNWAEESTILFHFLLPQPTDSRLLLSPEHTGGGGRKANPALDLRILAFHDRHVLEGTFRAKGKRNAFCGSEVE